MQILWCRQWLGSVEREKRWLVDSSWLDLRWEHRKMRFPNQSPNMSRHRRQELNESNSQNRFWNSSLNSESLMIALLNYSLQPNCFCLWRLLKQCPLKLYISETAENLSNSFNSRCCISNWWTMTRAEFANRPPPNKGVGDELSSTRYSNDTRQVLLQGSVKLQLSDRHRCERSNGRTEWVALLCLLKLSFALLFAFPSLCLFTSAKKVCRLNR